MSVQPAPRARTDAGAAVAPGIRLGWTCRDRRLLAAPYPEPQPDPDLVHEQMAERAALTQARYARGGGG